MGWLFVGVLKFWPCNRYQVASYRLNGKCGGREERRRVIRHLVRGYEGACEVGEHGSSGRERIPSCFGQRGRVRMGERACVKSINRGCNTTRCGRGSSGRALPGCFASREIGGRVCVRKGINRGCNPTRCGAKFWPSTTRLLRLTGNWDRSIKHALGALKFWPRHLPGCYKGVGNNYGRVGIRAIL